MVLLFAWIPMILFAGIEFILFHNALIVLTAAIILTTLACAVAHFSLRKLESRIRISLQMLGFGPTNMFKELE